MRIPLVVLSALCLLPRAASAQPRKPLTERSLKVLQRATRMTLSQRARIAASFPDKKLTNASADASYRSRFDTAEPPLLDSANAALAETPAQYTAGLKFEPQKKLVEKSRLFGGTKHKIVMHHPTNGDIRTGLEGVRARWRADLDANAAKLTSLERAFADKLDRRFASERVAFLKKLQTVDTEKLYQATVQLVHEIDEGASARQIRKEQTGESHATETTRLATHGLIRSTGISVDAAQHAVSHSLVLTATHYTVNVHTADAEALTGPRPPGSLSAPEARLFAEKLVQVSDMVKALETRAPHLAAGLGHWGRESSVEFRKLGFARTVNLARVHRDLAEIEDSHVVTPGFAQTLKSELAARANKGLEQTPLLD